MSAEIVQSVKFSATSVGATKLTAASGFVKLPLEMKLGNNEVGVILAVQHSWRWRIVPANDFRADAWIVRATYPATDILTSDALFLDDRCVDYSQIADEAIGAAYRKGNFVNEYKVLPYPAVTLRNPIAVIYDNTLSLTRYACCIWWLPQLVTDKTLTQLMVKQHA